MIKKLCNGGLIETHPLTFWTGSFKNQLKWMCIFTSKFLNMSLSTVNISTYFIKMVLVLQNLIKCFYCVQNVRNLGTLKKLSAIISDKYAYIHCIVFFVHNHYFPYICKTNFQNVLGGWFWNRCWVGWVILK